MVQTDLSRPATDAISSRSQQDNLRVLPLEVTINGLPGGQWVFVERNGFLYVTEDAFEEWRVNRRTTAEPIEYRNEKWHALAAVNGYQQGKINYATNTVALDFAGHAFSATRVVTDKVARPVLSTPELSAFLNYDFNASQVTTTGGYKGIRTL